MEILTEHYGYHDYPLDRCTSVQHLLVERITLEKMTGKRNLPAMPGIALRQEKAMEQESLL